MSPTLLFVVALDAEARPLIDHYRLRSQKQSGIRLYYHNAVALAISGIGSINAAATTAHALSHLPANTVALNVGIAGSDNPLGKLYFANRICQGASHPGTTKNARALYPAKPFRTPLPGITVRTVDVPNTQYCPSIAWDMEAYAFCVTARRYTTAELVHCLKIVSDNSEQPLTEGEGKSISLNLNAARVNELVGNQLQDIAGYANELMAVANQLPVIHNVIGNSDKIGSPNNEQGESGQHNDLNSFRNTENNGGDREATPTHQYQTLKSVLGGLHITEAQSVQINDLVSRHVTLGIPLPEADLIQQCSKAAQLIKQLQLTLADKHPSFALND